MRATLVLLAVACAVTLSCRAGAPARTAPAPSSAGHAPNFRVDPAAIGNGSAELVARLRETPHAYFRFLNKPWTQAVCDEYRQDLEYLPKVRLHGDAHVEQYAVTADSRGLDDFDDSALGPAVVDIVRFLGSLHLVARQNGWQKDSPRFVEAFFRGYRRALENPAYVPKEPAVAGRLRQRPVRSQLEFLAWAESLMREGPPETMEVLQRGIARLRVHAREQMSEYSDGYVSIKKFGLLHMGIGSALARKVLLRVEGPTIADDDDVIIEAKELARLDSASCVSIPPPVEAFRVVSAASQLGRLHNRLLVVIPQATPDRTGSPGWWLRSWEPSYRELEIADIVTPQDLLQVAEDAGAQLGAANTLEEPGVDSETVRRRELATVRRLEPRIRRTAVRLTAEVLDAWQALNAARP